MRPRQRKGPLGGLGHGDKQGGERRGGGGKQECGSLRHKHEVFPWRVMVVSTQMLRTRNNEGITF